MKPAVVVPVVVAMLLSGIVQADQVWEVRGSFVAIKPGSPQVAVLRLPDGRTIEVPVDALAAGSRDAVRTAAMGSASPSANGQDPTGAVTVRGPFGRPVRVSVPESIAAIEADAIHCRSAEQAADVYRLALADDSLSPEQRPAADARLRQWIEMADKGFVRLGDRWVSSDEARAAAGKCDKAVSHALELMRLGNADLAEDELRKAARLDPESGRASFVMGLSYALVARNYGKASDHFAEVVNREPGNAAALINLAVSEVLTRRFVGVANHFRGALANAVDPAVVGENVAWAVKLAGDAKSVPAFAKNRMPEKTVEELNDLYRTLTQDLNFKPTVNASSPRFLGPDGVACTAATLGDVAAIFDSAQRGCVAPRRALGFIIAPGRIVCPRQVVIAADGMVLDEVIVESPADHDQKIPARVVAAPDEGDVALLACDAIVADPLVVATRMPPLPDIVAIERSGDSWLNAPLTASRGKVMTQGLQVQARGRFVHTAVVPRGFGGGPILDSSGRIIGMVGATPHTALSGNAAGLGIPVERIVAILEDHLSGNLKTDATPEQDAASAERRAIAGTVVVSAAGAPAELGAAAKAAP